MTQDYIKNAGWIFAEKFFRIGVGFVIFAFISRVLGPADFGLLSYYQTLTTMLLCITGLGFDNILINEFSKKTNLAITFSTAFWSRIIVSVTTVLITGLIVFVSALPWQNKFIFLLCLLSLIFQTQSTYFSFYQATLQAEKATKISLATLILSSAFKFYLLQIDANVFWFAFSYTFDFLMSFIFFLVLSKRITTYEMNVRHFDFAVLKHLLALSWPIIASSIIIILYTRLDQLMIMRIMGPEAVATFSIAIKISEAYLFVPMALVISYYPLIAREPDKDNVKFYFDIIFFVSMIMALIILLLSYFFIPVLFGPQYADVYSVLTLTIFGGVFSVFGAACTNLMIVYGLTYIRLIRAIFGLAINFALNLLLIPKYGLMGAAFATLISQIVATWLSNALNKKTYTCFVWQANSIFTLGIPGGFKLISIILKKKK
ncbi:flippase [Cronobacter dublinensis]